MDYQFENLGPERFQEFCQSLLVKSFPKLQCFPVAQPDGGRDATAYIQQGSKGNFLVFQVKYVRKPLAESDCHKWLIDTVQGESEKVSKLIPKSAVEYYLLTNIPGTAHLDAGSIDKVQAILRDSFAIPSQCWWRDDLSRRLDSAWDLKWAYPELLSGNDILRLMIESGASEDFSRHTRTIRAFMREQYEKEVEVKFKQVELQNKLLDLFIDVPIDIERFYHRSKGRNSVQIDTVRTVVASCGIMPEFEFRREPINVGAATMLLHPTVQKVLNRVVLEGAPGQGKSTITQYLCQVHRMGVLGVLDGEARINESHRKTGIRLPFRIDCRDLAGWICNRNPFSPDENLERVDSSPKSLEGFLAAQITAYSGGSEFTVADLQAVAARSALLLAFDGLDEVADLKLRRDVVSHIASGTNRLEEVCASLQTVVTSRPAAFENSPCMPTDKYVYFELGSLSTPLIEQYSRKWTAARKLHGREAKEVEGVLKSRMDQPHLRELARNPMQLAILLSLVHTRGVSLPDKRTALYNNYVDLFFSREAEKSASVRDNRDLLIDLHCYLAWILHSEAETEMSRGSVTFERLGQLVNLYLSSEGYDSSLASQLFTGMVERVVALVSRIQGTYEFEVQPLREYFAARYLYSTSPYSPTGSERRGTLPDRFDTIARNHFWLNVTRFFSGCYDKGQLPSLVDRLEELSNSEGYADTSYAQELASTLLSDWVFTQHPKSMRQVVEMIISPLSLRRLVAGQSQRGRTRGVSLPKGCGREELFATCFEYLRSAVASDYRREVCEIVREHSSPNEIKVQWIATFNEYVCENTERIHEWINTGLFMGVFHSLSEEEVTQIGEHCKWSSEIMRSLIISGKGSVISEGEARFTRAVDSILEGTLSVLASRKTICELEALMKVVSLERYTPAMEQHYPIPLNQLPRTKAVWFNEAEIAVRDDSWPEYEMSAKVRELVAVSEAQGGRYASEWATQLSPWNALVEAGRRLFGERFVFNVLATVAAGIRSRDERYAYANQLHDSAVPLCERVRYARLRAGTANWWREQIESAPSRDDLILSLLVFSCWSGSSAIVSLHELFESKICSLTDIEWRRLATSIRRISGDRQDAIQMNQRLSSLPESVSERFAVCFYPRTNYEVREKLFDDCFVHYDGDDVVILEHCQAGAIMAANNGATSWESLLPLIRRCYARGAIADRYWGRVYQRGIVGAHIPVSVAKEIVSAPDQYPSVIVAMAEGQMRQRVVSSAEAVGIVAERDKWFK